MIRALHGDGAGRQAQVRAGDQRALAVRDDVDGARPGPLLDRPGDQGRDGGGPGGERGVVAVVGHGVEGRVAEGRHGVVVGPQVALPQERLRLQEGGGVGPQVGLEAGEAAVAAEGAFDRRRRG